MITEEEKREIIDRAVEKALLMLPEVVGNLMTQHIALNKMNTKFYADHPEFVGRKDIVASVIEMVDGDNPFMDYEDLLTKAIPEIRKRIATTKNLITDKAMPVVDRNFEAIDITGNGEI